MFINTRERKQDRALTEKGVLILGKERANEVIWFAKHQVGRRLIMLKKAAEKKKQAKIKIIKCNERSTEMKRQKSL